MSSPLAVNKPETSLESGGDKSLHPTDHRRCLTPVNIRRTTQAGRDNWLVAGDDAIIHCLACSRIQITTTTATLPQRHAGFSPSFIAPTNGICRFKLVTFVTLNKTSSDMRPVPGLKTSNDFNAHWDWWLIVLELRRDQRVVHAGDIDEDSSSRSQNSINRSSGISDRLHQHPWYTSYVWQTRQDNSKHLSAFTNVTGTKNATKTHYQDCLNTFWDPFLDLFF